MKTIIIEVKDEDAEDVKNYISAELKEVWKYKKGEDFTIEVFDNTQ